MTVKKILDFLGVLLDNEMIDENTELAVIEEDLNTGMYNVLDIVGFFVGANGGVEIRAIERESE